MWFLYKGVVKAITYFTLETGNSVRNIIIDISRGLETGKYELGKVRILEVENETLEDKEGRIYGIGDELNTE